ncbi:metal-dependent hydrolase [Williamsia sp.]|uniref:metal-dependent hydrolase n=1 Tax=Williamsia sp. TaxID=1872085 RepID=UPI002F951282
MIKPRDVTFDWAGMPLHYVGGNPLATHLINVLHLVLPEGEEWFVETFKEALPYIDDEDLREDVVGFIGQEAVHASAHTTVLDHLKSQGLDPTPYTDQMSFLFGIALAKRPSENSDPLHGLVERLAFIAGIEHLTAFLGNWALNEARLDDAVHPTMLDLLRWHGAEEVEHRSVAFEVMEYFDGRYSRRIRTYLLIAPTVAWYWARGVRFLMQNDPSLGGASDRRVRWSDWGAVTKRGLFPNGRSILRAGARYLRRSYHPSQDGSTTQAVRYLAASSNAAESNAEAPRE